MRFSDAFNFVHSQSSTLAWLGKASKDIQRSVFLVVFGVGQNQFELVDLHEADHVVVGDIGEDPVFVDVLDLHDSALLDEEEVLALGPSVFGGVAVNLALCQEVPVLLVKLGRESDLLGGILAFVQKEVVVLVLIINLLFEEILYFFEVGEGVDEGYFILLGVIVDLVVVQFVVATDGRADSVQQRLALHQQIRQDVVLAHLPQLHNRYLIIIIDQGAAPRDRLIYPEFRFIALNGQTLIFELSEMQENRDTIDYDTSQKKYPFNKYFNNKELANLTKKVFNTRTMDLQPKRAHSKKHSSKSKKRSLMSTKTMSSSRARPTPTVSITHENYRAFTKDDIADELHHYKQLCLKLRKDNHQLKDKLESRNRVYKESIVELQNKINKLNQSNLKIRERELREQQLLAKEKRSKEKPGKAAKKNEPTGRKLEGEFKRFFLHFLDNVSMVDTKVGKRVSQQKSMEGKLIVGQRLLREGCDFLREKKFKFSSICQ